MGCPSQIVWSPQPGPQQALLSCPAYEVMFGGARGGGKTDACLGEWAIHADKYQKHAKGVFFRHTLPQLEEAIARSQQIYTPLGAKWLEQAKTWKFANGAVLKFRFLERDKDAENYQGHSYTRLYFEELTNWADPAPIFKVMATLRSGAGVPCRMRASANPGGPGHHWVKQRYIDPAPNGYTPIVDKVTGQTRVFIPSKLTDNRILTTNDPEYINRLRGSGSEALVRAWVNGDWSVIDGAYFSQFDPDRHSIKPFSIPMHWTRFRSFDWGSSKPFGVYWLAVADGTTKDHPRGALIVYREWYGCEEGKANVGLKLKNSDIAKGILKRELPGERMEFSKADPAIFAENGGKSIAEQFSDEGVQWQRADNTRIAGWKQISDRLEGDGDGRPMLFIFDTCKHLIRTLPALQHDQHNTEDLDTDGEDHAADALRYGVMSRQWVRDVPVNSAPKPGTFDWLVQADQKPTSKYRR